MKLAHGLLPLVTAACSTMALAGEPTFEITQTAYAYTSATETETSKSGKRATNKEEGFQTMPSDLELQVAYEKWRFTVFPTIPGEAFDVAREVAPNLEVGLELAYNRQKTDGETVATTEDDKFIPHVQYTIESGKHAVELELHLGLTRTSSREEKFDAAEAKTAVVETKESAVETELAVNYSYGLTDNLSYAAGIGYTIVNAKESIEDTKTTGGELEIKLLQVRYGIY